LSLPLLLFGVTLALPPAVFVACLLLADRPGRVLQLSTVAALVLALAATLSGVDVEIDLLSGRALVMSPIAQLGVQLLALGTLGLTMSIAREADDVIAHWMPIAWLSLSGLVVALLITSLPLAALIFVGAALIWALGLPPESREASAAPVLRYVGLLALILPMLLLAFRLAEFRTSSSTELERVVLALAVPAFGLLLGLIPMHAWTLTLASGTPWAMIFGVLALVQSGGFVLLLRTLEEYPWITSVAGAPLVLGGALSAAMGGWLALSSARDDPDDWLVYAVIAHSGFLLVGLGTQSASAAGGVVLMLFARMLALVLLGIAPRVRGSVQRAASAGATLTLAGTPGLAGFPGLWLVLRRLDVISNGVAYLALLAGSGMLMATAVRRWSPGVGRGHVGGGAAGLAPAGGPGQEASASSAGDAQGTGQAADARDTGAERAVWALLVLLVILGVAPQLIAPAFGRALRGLFLPLP